MAKAMPLVDREKELEVLEDLALRGLRDRSLAA